MPTEKQLLRDREYFGEYKIGGRYSVEQWEKILSTPVLVDSTDLSILKEIFASANHAAPITQLCFHHNKEEQYYLDKMNSLGEKLGRPNGFIEEVDLQGNEYWWYLIFWGRMTKEGILEWKLQPALAEALEALDPSLEQNYIAYMSHIEYCTQTRIEQADAIFLAAALLLFEKYHLEHPSNIDDLLLMQYEIQQRAQKIYGQDISVNVITDLCNADSDRCQYHYLRDIYKYWRIAYPNEFDGDKERPSSLDPTYSVMSHFGYLTVQDLYHFIETDYAKLADPNFIEINTNDALYKMINFLKNNHNNGYMNLKAPTEEQIEQFLSIKADAKDAIAHFHSIGDILLEQYPNFAQTEKATWLMADKTTIQNSWKDCFQILEYENVGPILSTILNCLEENSDKAALSICLTIPFSSEEMRENILEICNPLTALTSANFRLVDTDELEIAKAKNFGTSLTAYVSYTEAEMLEGGEEKFMPQFETVLQILASYHMNLCQQLFTKTQALPAIDSNSDNASPSKGESTFAKQNTTITPLEKGISSEEIFDEELFAAITIEDIKLKPLLTTLNDRIAYLLSRSFQIEPALFYPLKANKDIQTLGNIFYEKIIPLLEKWFEKDYEKIRLVLGDFKKTSRDYEFIPKETLDPAILFGDIAKQYNFLPKESYFIQKKAFYKKETYIEL